MAKQKSAKQVVADYLKYPLVLRTKFLTLFHQTTTKKNSGLAKRRNVVLQTCMHKLLSDAK